MTRKWGNQNTNPVLKPKREMSKITNIHYTKGIKPGPVERATPSQKMATLQPSPNSGQKQYVHT